MLRAIVCTFLMLCLIGCSGRGSGKETRHTLSERQRDSVLARSRLPGATVVGHALAAADSAAARAKRVDSQLQ